MEIIIAQGTARATALAVLQQEAAVIAAGTTRASGRINKQCSDYSLDMVHGPFGLFINMKTYLSVSLEYLPADAALSGFRVYVHLSSSVHELNATTANDRRKEAEAQTNNTSSAHTNTSQADTSTAAAGKGKPTKMAIDVEGGFSADGDMIDPAGNFAAVEPTLSYRLCVYTPARALSAAAARSLANLYCGGSSSSSKHQQKRAEGDEEAQEQQHQQWRSDLQLLQQHEEQLLQQLSFLSLDDPEVPVAVATAAKHLAEMKHAVADPAPSAAWVEEVFPSKYAANLPVVENPPKISPSNWKCADCGASTNLWLNLSDGFIGCGRKLYGAGGGCADGREGAAIRHYKETGSIYPLIVKLGTISPDSADVFSYAPDEDSTVIDPNLPEHLARFGIETQQLRKTERSTNELAIDLNCKYDWASLAASAAEQQKQQQQPRGAGAVGLRNLGNTCYVNSVLQALFSVPRFREKFLSMYEPLICGQGLPGVAAAAGGPAKCLSLQLGALAVALQTRRVCMQKALGLLLLQKTLQQRDVQIGERQLLEDLPYMAHDSVSPLSLRAIIGSLHAEFASSRQQDAEEFLSLLLSWVIEREAGDRRQLQQLRQLLQLGDSCAATAAASALGVTDETLKTAEEAAGRGTVDSLFSFGVEQRLVCLQSHQVRYTYSQQQVLALPIPVDIQQQEEQQEQQQAQQQQRQQKRRKGAEGTPTESETGADTGGDTTETHGESEEKIVAAAPSVPISRCIGAAAAAAVVQDYLSPATGSKGDAEKTLRLTNYPEYLLVFLKRFYISDRWIPKKLKCSVQIPEEVSFEELRAFGLQPEEQELPDKPSSTQQQQLQQESSSEEAEIAGETAAAAEDALGAEVVATLESMGFSSNAAKRAVRATGGAAAESCVEWLMGHLDDPDINDPLPLTRPPSSSATISCGAAGEEPDAEAVSNLIALGFDERSVRAAFFATRRQLSAAGGTQESGVFDSGRAADWLLSQGQNLAAAVDEVLPAAAATAAAPVATDEERETEARESAEEEAAIAGLSPLERCRRGLGDGAGIYRLSAFVSHLGSSISGGHYICHVRSSEDPSCWLQYNDEKVLRVPTCNTDHAYLLLFKRIDVDEGQTET